MEGCSKWKRFLNNAIGDEPLIAALQEFFGSCLSPRQFGRMLILAGPPESGKSTISNILTAIVGSERVSYAPLSRLGNQFTLAEMSRKQVNISDCDDTKDFNQAELKAILHGDPLTASFKFKPPFIFTPEIKLVSIQRELPAGLDKSPGIFRRMLIVQLRQPTNREDNLLSQLKMELAEIKAWAEEGLRRLEKNGSFSD